MFRGTVVVNGFLICCFFLWLGLRGIRFTSFFSFAGWLMLVFGWCRQGLVMFAGLVGMGFGEVRMLFILKDTWRSLKVFWVVET